MLLNKYYRFSIKYYFWELFITYEFRGIKMHFLEAGVSISYASKLFAEPKSKREMFKVL